jgi:hypothetical protein
MKTKIYQLTKACLAMAVAAFLLIAAASPLMAQPGGEEYYSIPFLGMDEDHEGVASWQADGTGPEPYGFGHQIPIPTFLPMPYYGASRDYDDIDPDPNAAMSHFTGEIQGFPLFVQAMDENGYTPANFKMKSNLGSLGEDELGYDWFIVGENNDEPHAFYYGFTFYIFLDGEPMISFRISFWDAFCSEYWYFETSYGKPDSAWTPDTDPAVKAVGRAFLEDVGDEEVRLLGVTVYTGDFSGNGRVDGYFWNIQGIIEKGRPELPFLGMASEHQGMAGWNADGTGPEPAERGHGAQRYYIASRDYDDIDPDPNAAFGHFLLEMKGFMNLALQLEYRDYTPDQLLIKNGLSSLGADSMGLDWGFANGTDYWCNYYDIDYRLFLDGEQIITGLVDTSLSWMVQNPLFWWCEATFDRPRNGSAFASEDAQIVAGGFLKDLECRKLYYDLQELTYDADTFNGNGRYNGGYFNVQAARLLARQDESCCFVQTDTLGTPFTNETHWVEAHSPYFIDNSLFIPEGHTLTIDPGVKVALRGPYNINVKGNIIAEGTEEQGILFTRSNPLREWNSLTYDGPLTAPASSFRFCTFEFSHSIKAEPLNSGGAFAIGLFDDISFSRCIFRHNTADLFHPGWYPPSGGAIALWDASPTIDSCTFYDNEADYGGAILAYSSSSPQITYSLFHSNHAIQDGGAIDIYGDCSPMLVNNTITLNTADGFGGGIDLYDNEADSIIFINNIIFGNSGAPAFAGQQVSLTSEYNVASFIYNDVEGGVEGFGPGTVDRIFYASSNIKADPEFCSPEEFMFEIDSTSSPCWKTGYNGANIGALGPCIITSFEEPQTFSSDFLVFPNPVRSGSPVTVEFNLESTGPVILEIFNLTGTRVAQPIGSTYAAGDHRVTFSTRDLPAGLYIARLAVKGDCYSARFIVF